MADEKKDDDKPRQSSVAQDVGALLKGLKTTLLETFRPVVTTMYPEDKTPRSERYRGRHYLRRYENGLERCIGCELCAAACPVGCILVIAAENTDENRVSPGERYAKTYEINMLRCIFFVAAAVAILGGVGVVSFHQPIRSVLSLVLVMLALSVIFLLLSAQFVFAVQIIVYAGAVMVLFLFVIALLGPARELGRGRLRYQGWTSAVFVLVLLGLMWTMLQGVQYRQPDKTDVNFFGTVQ